MELLAGGGDESPAAPDPRPATRPVSIPKPVIGALNGACAGIGLVYALTCDLRFAAAGAKLTTAFSRVGLIAEYGSSWLLPRLVGTSTALDLLLSGRTVTSEEALELGLVDRVHPPEEVLDRALAYARELATHVSPTAMGVIKRQVYGDLERPLDEALERAEEHMVASLRRPDRAEGAASFTERRPPRFAPLDPDAV